MKLKKSITCMLVSICFVLTFSSAVAFAAEPVSPVIKVSSGYWNPEYTQIGRDETNYNEFFREPGTVTISATDTEGNLDKLYYYISGEALTAAQMADIDVWVEIENGGTIAFPFDASAVNEYVICAKAVDKSGNAKYTSSNVLVYDSVAPVMHDISYDDEGNTYFYVTDDYLLQALTGTTVLTPIETSADGRTTKYVFPPDNQVHFIYVQDQSKTYVFERIEAYHVYNVTIPAEQTGYTISPVNDANRVRYQDKYTFTLAVDERYEKTDAFAVKANGTVIEEKDGKYTITVEEDNVITVEGVADVTAPSGEIKVKENGWKTFNSDITFNIFDRDQYDVTITAEDAGAGVKSIEYLVSATEISEEDIRTADGWTEYSAFRIENEGEYIIYAKITDNSGNVTYLNSEGLIIDKTVPVVSGIEQNKTYCSAVEVTVHDNYNGVAVTLGGSEIALTDGKFTVAPAEGTQTVVVTDKAGNTMTYTITVNNGHTFEWITDKEAAEGIAGSMHEECSVCGYKKDAVEIPALPIPEYPSVVKKTDGGKVEIDNPNPQPGDEVTVTPKPEDGKKVDKIIVTDKDGNPVEIIDNGDGTFTFVQPEDGEVTIKVIFKKEKPGKEETETEKETEKETDKPSPDKTDSVKTGDNSHIWLWLVLLIEASGVIIITTISDKKIKNLK